MATGRQVEDRKSAMAERGGGIDEETGVVGTTVRQNVCHRRNPLVIRPVSAQVEASGDAAHAPILPTMTAAGPA
jgi:hypothetical protein